MSQQKLILNVQNLTKRFPGVVALNGVQLQLKAGEFSPVLSGCFLRCLMAVDFCRFFRQVPGSLCELGFSRHLLAARPAIPTLLAFYYVNDPLYHSEFSRPRERTRNRVANG